MSKALIGYIGPTPATALLRELDELKARVAELERVLGTTVPGSEEIQGVELSAVPGAEAALA